MNSFFTLDELPDDPLALVYRACMIDPNPDKINLCVGIYADDDGKPFVFESIQKAAREVDITNNDYYIVQGNKKFLENTGKLIFGDNFSSENFAMQQICGGAHGISIFAQLLREEGKKDVFLGIPTWTNHQGIFSNFNLHTFPHLDENQVHLGAYTQVFEVAPEGSTIIIHVGPTHNPTGVNITAKQICKYANVINKKNICLLLDAAYMGFGNGLEADLEEIRIFDAHIDNYALAFSHSKNASLYKQKVGALYVKTQNKAGVESHIRRVVHRSICNPPGFGVEIMNIIHEKYFNEWKVELDTARQNLQNRRDSLASLLPERFQFIRDGKGLFSMLGLTEDQINTLRETHSIYLAKSSRISFGGLQSTHYQKLSDAIKKVL